MVLTLIKMAGRTAGFYRFSEKRPIKVRAIIRNFTTLKVFHRMMSADSTNTLTLLKSNAHQWRTTFRRCVTKNAYEGRGRGEYCRLVVGRYCISQENTGYKLISKLGWCRGRGLGRKEQGAVMFKLVVA